MTHDVKPRVLVIGGDEDPLAGSYWFSEDVRRRFGLPAVEFVDCAMLDRPALRRILREALAVGRTEPLVVAYNGHGGVNGWAPWKERSMCRITYQELAPLAKRYAGPLLFVNSSCFAKAMVDEFEKQSVPADRVGVIAACETAWTSIGSLLLDHLLASWLRGRAYAPGYMGEAFILPPTKRREQRVVWFFDCVSDWRLLARRVFLRRWYACRSVWRPLEHATFFSKRWGAVHDGLVTRHLVPERVRSAQEEAVESFMSVVPYIQEIVVRMKPPRP